MRWSTVWRVPIASIILLNALLFILKYSQGDWRYDWLEASMFVALVMLSAYGFWRATE